MSSDILPQRAFHPTNHVQQDIHPTDNPPPSEKEERGGRGTTSSRTTTGAVPELSPPKSACSGDAVLRTSTRVTVPMGQCAAPAPGAPSPWDSTLGNIEDSISQCTFLQMTYTAVNPHACCNWPRPEDAHADARSPPDHLRVHWPCEFRTLRSLETIPASPSGPERLTPAYPTPEPCGSRRALSSAHCHYRVVVAGLLRLLSSSTTAADYLSVPRPP